MIKYIIVLLCGLGSLYASEGTSFGDSDYIPRVVNFLIFAGILYYLVADLSKKFFKERRDGIAGELEAVQERLKKSAKDKEGALEEVEKAKKKAEEIVATAKKEAVIIQKNYTEMLEDELKSIEKQYEDMMVLDRRKAEREVVTSIVSELFDESSKDIDKDAYIHTVLKKVA